MGLFDDLDTLIQSGRDGNSTAATVLANAGTPSVSIAVLDNGQIASHCFSTVGDNTDTIFQACSISKAITALAMMKLVEQKSLTLDQTIKQLLPKDALDVLIQDESQARRELIEAITVRQLMSHTSGLSGRSFPGYPVRHGEPLPSLKDIIAGQRPVNTMRLRLTGLPGHAFVYSGGGIIMQQIIMEAITCKDFSTLMQDLVLGPLNMTRSHYRSLPADEMNWAKSYYTGYTPCENAQHFFPESAVAGLWTTPTDLLKAVLAVQDSLDSADDSGFLKQAIAKEMLTEVDSGVGLSWFLPGDEGTLFEHSGSNSPGYICLATGYANLKGDEQGAAMPKRSGIAVMTNSVEGHHAVGKVYMAVSYLKKWPTIFKLRTAYVPFPLPEQDPGVAWKRWVGSWADEKKKHHYTITVGNDGRPRLAFNQLAPTRLFPTAGSDSEFSDGSGFCELALEGMEMMVRLKGEEGKEILQVCDGRTDIVTDLVRAS